MKNKIYSLTKDFMGLKKGTKIVILKRGYNYANHTEFKTIDDDKVMSFDPYNFGIPCVEIISKKPYNFKKYTLTEVIEIILKSIPHNTKPYYYGSCHYCLVKKDEETGAQNGFTWEKYKASSDVIKLLWYGDDNHSRLDYRSIASVNLNNMESVINEVGKNIFTNYKKIKFKVANEVNSEYSGWLNVRCNRFYEFCI